MWIANRARFQEIDRIAIGDDPQVSDELMERAGAAVFEAVLEWTEKGPIAVVCGKGNNGGDGFVVARLAFEAGMKVMCLVGVEESQLGEAAARMLKKLKPGRSLLHHGGGVDPIFFGDEQFWPSMERLNEVALVVDALFGTGLKGLADPTSASIIEAINASSTEVLSVDVPSGLDCDTGAELGSCIDASETVTFGLPKAGFFLADGPNRTGIWRAAPIEFPAELLDEPTGVWLTRPQEASDLMPVPPATSHKGSMGRVLIVAGCRAFRGAAVLAAKGAIRAGAGLVTVAAIEPVIQAIAAQLPEATFIELPEDGGFGSSIPGSLLGAETYDSVVLGPGLGTSPSVYALLEAIFGECRVPCVLDADALNLISAGLSLPGGPCVLTPHPGEMARLMPDTKGTRFDIARAAAERSGKVVLLKGAYSVIAVGGEPLRVNPTGNAGMATAGMGDVLSGIIGTLLAQGLSPFDAAWLAAYWHGHAGDRLGQVGYTASDLADALPAARGALNAE